MRLTCVRAMCECRKNGGGATNERPNGREGEAKGETRNEENKEVGRKGEGMRYEKLRRKGRGRRNEERMVAEEERMRSCKLPFESRSEPSNFFNF
jgi:hypothetical protein